MANVFVIDEIGQSCLPCHPVRARRLLNSGRARVYSVVPFTIQLNRVVEKPIGSFTIGVDDGAKEVGIAVVNEHNKEVVFSGTIRLRQDVHRKMLQRAMYRRNRRSRNLRYRQARFNNRSRKNWLPPTIRQKKDSIVRVVIDLKKRLNITEIVVEQGQFDTSSLVAGRKLTGVEYQKVEFGGSDFRAKVLWRDHYVCQRAGCGSVNKLKAHHIKFRSEGGTDTVSNGITLCENCHDSLHKDEWFLTKKPKVFKYPTHLQQGKNYLFGKLSQLCSSIKICFGWMTKQWRDNIQLTKIHFNDAISMVCKVYLPKISNRSFLIIPKRRKIWDDNPTKTCEEKNGFRHWDLIKSVHSVRGVVVGSIRSLKKSAIMLRTDFNDNFPVSYNKSKLLYRFDSIVYV